MVVAEKVTGREGWKTETERDRETEGETRAAVGNRDLTRRQGHCRKKKKTN